jgi:nitroreductase
MLKEAPLAIVVCADVEKGASEFTVKKYWIQDCSAVTQNIMLEAADLGLGSVWLGTYPKEEIIKPISELFGLPSNIVPVTIIAIGHPDGEVHPKNKFDPKKIHNEKW